MDVWYKGKNVLCDGGSFKYNTDEETVKYFAGTESHNTVMLADHDQMLKGPRFIWLNWSQALQAALSETENHYIFRGEVNCFSYLEKEIVHRRKITKTKGKPEWKVEDEIIHKPDDVEMRQLWHHEDDCIKFFSPFTESITKEGWRSIYYGVKEKTKQTEFRTNKDNIETTIYIEE
jgi:hypothetical protein